ncbi:MAG: ABC transporter ATP-binding protein [Pseudomonadota bacterium]
MSEAPVLSIRDLSLRLPAWADRGMAIEDLSLDLKAGEILCLVGESGSGKSITARAVMGLLPREIAVQSGAIRYRDTDLLTLPKSARRQLAGSRISMIFQEPLAALNPVFTAGSQIDEVLRIHGRADPADRRQRVRTLFEEVGLDDWQRFYRAYPHQLSGGQCQRVMIAMAMALDPDILIADEPTTALDVTTQARILDLIRTLRRQHEASILFITHDFGVVADIADRVAVMQHGRLVEHGPVRDVLDRPQHPYTQSLIEAVPKLAPKPPRTIEGAPVLEGRDITKRFRGGSLFGTHETKALDGVSLSVRPQETIGLVGESGSGKSTLAQCLMRLEPVTSGEVVLAGETITRLGDRRLRPYRRRFQVIFQDPYTALDPRQAVGEAIAEGPIIHGVDPVEARRQAASLLERVGLDPTAARRFPHQFSGGQRQRVCIARALALKPDILIADESVSALDVSVQRQILDLLRDIQATEGFALLFITHDLRIAAQLCDRIVVMRAGRIVEQGTTQSVFEDPQQPYTKDLLAAIPGLLAA